MNTLVRRMRAATEKVRAMLLRLGDGTIPPGTWNDNETEYVLSSPVRIWVVKCKNTLQERHSYNIQRVSASSLIGRGVKARDLFDISTSKLQFSIVKG